MNRWDIVLLVVAGYVATMALVRLMIRRRDQLLAEFRRLGNISKKRKQEKELEQKKMGQRGKAA